MMKHKYLILVSALLVSLLFSCAPKKSEPVTENKVDLIDISVNTNQPVREKYQPPFDMEKLKQGFADDATSTFLGNNSIKLYEKPKEKGFFGRYHLSKYYEKDKDMFVAGSLTVFNDTTPWLYDDMTDIFIELAVKYPGITIFNEIEIGSDISLVDKYLDKPFLKNDTLTVYKHGAIQMVALFKTKDGKIRWYKYGYYNEEVVNNIEKHIPLLLD
ncbi:hypothetical protein GGR21_003420 [Dysgonomonas hofstadii]|uniref:Lipoprotein n=1 Tax=Dysgonomonas hofstadii TaxID=637886 RepID=A0A840CZS4_9BACT|nr:hypothetical protein [Dysgonomonas hofstadii]MBB4037503.1 hypothetical protein [Dysgonomonas hofstadii]